MQANHHSTSLSPARVSFAWLLGLVLVCLPILQPLQATPVPSDSGAPPCHQQATDESAGCPHCDLAPRLCDCENCGKSLASSIPFSYRPLAIFVTTSIDIPTDLVATLPDPPSFSFFRPPIALS